MRQTFAQTKIFIWSTYNSKFGSMSKHLVILYESSQTEHTAAKKYSQQQGNVITRLRIFMRRDCFLKIKRTY